MQSLGSPSRQPTSHPRRLPSLQPLSLPSDQPSRQPLRKPISKPSKQPIKSPSKQPRESPSLQPSFLPTQQPLLNYPSLIPTVQPLGGPSFSPSSQPIAAPTVLPTRQAIHHPTSQPYYRPSFQPSKQPIQMPSRIPSKLPSIQPTHVPSMQPLLTPNSRPSLQPFLHPTVRPSMQPTSPPTRQPNAVRPTNMPSNQPSRHPSRVPTKQPNRFPTRQPLRFPTRKPTKQPTRNPSQRPSLAPSLYPSGQPSSSPSRSGKIKITRVPSRRPTLAPTSLQDSWTNLAESVAENARYQYDTFSLFEEVVVNNAVIIGGCNDWNSFSFGELRFSTEIETPISLQLVFYANTSSNGVSSVVCKDSEAIVSIMKSLRGVGVQFNRVSCNNNTWVVNMCHISDGVLSPAVCVDCSDPCYYNRSSFNFKQALSPCEYGGCSNCVGFTSGSFMKTFLISYATKFPPPSLRTFFSTPFREAVSVNAGLSASGWIYCAAYPSGEVPSSVDQLLLGSIPVAVVGSSNATILIGSLSASTRYDVYCATRNLYGIATTFAAVLQSKIPIETLCCKRISIKLMTGSVYQNTQYLDFVALDSDPSSNAILSIQTSVKVSLTDTVETFLSPANINLFGGTTA